MDFFGVVFLLLFIFAVVAFVIICLSNADLSLNFNDIFCSGRLGNLKGRVVWVTGASSGIGAAVAQEAAKHGAKLVLSARSIGKLEDIKRKCLAMGANHGLEDRDVYVLPLDMLNMDIHEDRVVKVLQHFGKISILFLCSGRTQHAPWELISPSVDREMFETNALGPVNLARKVMPYFVGQGGGQFAVVTGLQAKTGVPFMASCSASKFALQGYFETLRTETIGTGIDVTILVPGPTFSNILSSAATYKEGESFDGSMSSTDTRLTPTVVAQFAMVAVANKLEEAWIAPFPFLPLLYCNQYMPTITKRLANCIGPHVMERLKRQ